MIDSRQLMIVYQNALGHATKIAIHNASLKQERVETKDVLEIAKEIAREVVRIGTAAETKGK